MLTTGSVFAGYQILRLLGSGGMGEVYLAQHPRLPRRDAVKVLPAQISADPEFRLRFSREADLAAALWHPHIVGVHDRGEHNGQLWMAMDYVDGSDAARRLRRQHPSGMPRDQVVEIIDAIGQALDYAHDRGLLHRDVKPANILLSRPDAAQRRILLTDFGIGRWLDDISGLTATNMTVGTVDYAAPEQLSGRPVDGRADQYALAATAYHLLAGRPPFHHSNPAVVIGSHLTAPAPRLAAVRAELADLDAPLSRALAKDPADRFGSCAEFAAALRGTAPRPPAPPRRRLTRRTKVALAVAAAIGGAALTAGPDTGAPAPASAASTTSSSPAPAPEPTWSMHSLGSACSFGMLDATMTSAGGDKLRCMSGPEGYSWQPDTGVEDTAATIVRQIGWSNCIARFPRATCVASAAALAGAAHPSQPVFPEGVYRIPDAMPYGSYAAARAGGCNYAIRDKTGKDVGSGSGLGARPAVTITPAAAGGWFQTWGCTPWVLLGR